MRKPNFDGTPEEQAEAVKIVRGQADLSTAELADLLRVREDYVRKLEKGEKPVTGPVRLCLEMIHDGRLNPADELDDPDPIAVAY